MSDPSKKSPEPPPSAVTGKRTPVAPGASRPTVGGADGGSGTPDDHEVAKPDDKGMRGLDKSGGSRGGGR